MQAAESNAFSLRAIDGGRVLRPIRVWANAEASAQVVSDVGRVLRAAGCESTISGESQPAPISAGATVGHGLLFATPAPDWTAQCSGSIRRLRAFRPVIGGRGPSLDVSIATAADPSGPQVRSCVEFACRYAERSGIRQLRLVDLDDDAVAVANRFQALDVGVESAAEAARRLAAGHARGDVLVTSSPFAGILSAVAGELSGAAPLAMTLTADGRDFSVASATCASMAGHLLAAAEMLHATGQTATAARIADAVNSALEQGLHSAGLDLVRPYALQLDDNEFADAVIERLGLRPKSMRRCYDGVADAAPRRAAGPQLRLVGS